MERERRAARRIIGVQLLVALIALVGVVAVIVVGVAGIGPFGHGSASGR
ncbi:MAG: hypothetical protein LC749_12005 [Actinobacteria bacterium]|nr:hypothetical protein [Actinomycetota bacterium]